jgi:predicted aconitase
VHLTKDEERICDGESGWANQICMKILVRLGDLFNATRLIPIASTHVSGVSYKTLGDAPVDFLEALANSGAKANANSTLNPHSIDEGYIAKKLPPDLRQKQSAIVGFYQRMGLKPSLTCTPYYLQKFRKGSHLAWAESSAVVYANSVMGAYTNREGGPSALAAAIIGKTPDYGIHKAQNRQPQVLVNVETRLRDEAEFGALGILLGRVLADKIPVIQGLNDVSEGNLKQLGAALASTGMVNMFYYKNANAKDTTLERLSVETVDVKQTVESLTATSTEEPDLVFVGCPHCSVAEVKQIADSVGTRKVREDMEFWVCTSRCVKEKAAKYVRKLEQSGAHVLTDTCPVVTWTDKLGLRMIMTDSAKTAHYVPTLNNAEAILAPLEDCLRTVLEG